MGDTFSNTVIRRTRAFILFHKKVLQAGFFLVFENFFVVNNTIANFCKSLVWGMVTASQLRIFSRASLQALSKILRRAGR